MKQAVYYTSGVTSQTHSRDEGRPCTTDWTPGNCPALLVDSGVCEGTECMKAPGALALWI